MSETTDKQTPETKLTNGKATQDSAPKKVPQSLSSILRRAAKQVRAWMIRPDTDADSIRDELSLVLLVLWALDQVQVGEDERVRENAREILGVLKLKESKWRPGEPRRSRRGKRPDRTASKQGTPDTEAGGRRGRRHAEARETQGFQA